MTESIANISPTALPVFYRTYARKNSDSEPRENLAQVKARVLEGLVKLGNFTEEEVENLINYLENNELFPSGRYLWCGGLPFSEKQTNYYSLYNCSNITIEAWDDFGHNFNFLMQGNGSGAKLELSNIEKLPTITAQLNLKIQGKYGDISPGRGHTEISFLTNTNQVLISVGDSRKSWVDAYVSLLSLSSSSMTPWEVTIDVSNVRKKGEIIKGFGGRTNPVGLIPLFENVCKILNKAVGRKLTPLEVSQLLNEAALCTIAGNIRRSARIDQFSKEDEEGGLAKMNLWTQDSEGNWRVDPEKNALRMANFTRVWHSKPTKDEIKKALETQFYSAEGAIQYAPEAVARANADLLDTPEKKQKFIGLYCDSKEEAKSYLSELWERSRTPYEFPLDEKELEHRVSRYGMNPCGSY